MKPFDSVDEQVQDLLYFLAHLGQAFFNSDYRKNFPVNKDMSKIFPVSTHLELEQPVLAQIYGNMSDSVRINHRGEKTRLYITREVVVPATRGEDHRVVLSVTYNDDSKNKDRRTLTAVLVWWISGSRFSRSYTYRYNEKMEYIHVPQDGDLVTVLKMVVRLTHRKPTQVMHALTAILISNWGPVLKLLAIPSLASQGYIPTAELIPFSEVSQADKDQGTLSFEHLRYCAQRLCYSDDFSGDALIFKPKALLAEHIRLFEFERRTLPNPDHVFKALSESLTQQLSPPVFF